MNKIFEKTKKASRALPTIDGTHRDELLKKLSARIEACGSEIIAANAHDLEAMDKNNPLYDRLLLDEKRIKGIASDMACVATLPDPVGRVLCERTLPNGLQLCKKSVPFGVIGVIYEARPNVTFDVFSLCFKSGNAGILKGGKDAENSNRKAIEIIKSVLEENGFDRDCVNLLPSTHEAASELLEAVGYVDLVIPRGGRKLIDFVRHNSVVPCIETGAGVVHEYFDRDGNLEIGRKTITNAKTRRVSVCNALDCLIIDESRLNDLPALCADLATKNVEIFCDTPALKALSGYYPADLLANSDKDSYGTEFLAYRMAIKTVSGVDEAIAHINTFGSGHSESIITDNPATADKFTSLVDAACVYVNAPTSFTDGAQFGLGAEIGISTQKLGARGPMGLEELNTYKWIITGNGQTRA